VDLKKKKKRVGFFGSGFFTTTLVAIDTPVDLKIWKLIHTPPVT